MKIWYVFATCFQSRLLQICCLWERVKTVPSFIYFRFGASSIVASSLAKATSYISIPISIYGNVIDKLPLACEDGIVVVTGKWLFLSTLFKILIDSTQSILSALHRRVSGPRCFSHVKIRIVLVTLLNFITISCMIKLYSVTSKIPFCKCFDLSLAVVIPRGRVVSVGDLVPGVPGSIPSRGATVMVECHWARHIF